MYSVIIYGLTASPPTQAHQTMLRVLLQQTAKKCTPCTVTDNNNTATGKIEAVFNINGKQHKREMPPQTNDTTQNRIAWQNSIKRELSQKDEMDYVEIFCIPTADGPAVLNKTPSATAQHRYAMLNLASNIVMDDTQDSRIIVTDIELIFNNITGLPSYTANTLIFLQRGLSALLCQTPLENYLLTPEEQARSSEEKKTLISARCTAIEQYIKGNPTHILTTGIKIHKISLAMGSDSFASLKQWNNFTDINHKVTQLLVFARENQTINLQNFLAANKVQRLTIDAELGNCSSTKIRRALATLSLHAGYFIAENKNSRDEARQLLQRWLSPDVFNYIKQHNLYHALVAAVSDSEGNGKHFFNSLKMNIEHTQQLQQRNIATNFTPIQAFLGDACDKGQDDLKIVSYIRNDATKNLWLLIAGNRDDNKIRLLELLNPNYINHFNTINTPPFWAPRASSPAAFVNLLPDKAYVNLTMNEKRIIILQWMLQETMGAPQAFAHRRAALSEILNRTEITDEEVMLSFIESILQENEFEIVIKFEGLEGIQSKRILPPTYQGLYRWYINHSHTMAIADNTFYSHAGLPQKLYPYLQNGIIFDSNAIDTISSERFHAWITARNSERVKNIEDYIQQALASKVTGIIAHPAVIASLPKSNDYPYNIQSFDSFSQAYASELLARCNIKCSVHGHQIVLTFMPCITREAGIVTVNIDTRLANQTQYTSATIIISGEIYCLSQDENKQLFLSESIDTLLGTEVDTTHHYTVQAKTVVKEKTFYALVCREKKINNLFFTVDADYGITSISETDLKKWLHAQQDKVNSNKKAKHITTSCLFLTMHNDATTENLATLCAQPK